MNWIWKVFIGIYSVIALYLLFIGFCMWIEMMKEQRKKRRNR